MAISTDWLHLYRAELNRLIDSVDPPITSIATGGSDEAVQVLNGNRESTKPVDKKKIAMKAERLLRRTLPLKEWLRYKTYGHVRVRGSKGGLYVLGKEKAFGIKQITDDQIKVLCVVPSDVNSLDPADMIVAQYLGLINDEKKFLKEANWGNVYNRRSATQPRQPSTAYFIEVPPAGARVTVGVDYETERHIDSEDRIQHRLRQIRERLIGVDGYREIMQSLIDEARNAESKDRRHQVLIERIFRMLGPHPNRIHAMQYIMRHVRGFEDRQAREGEIIIDIRMETVPHDPSMVRVEMVTSENRCHRLQFEINSWRDND